MDSLKRNIISKYDDWATDLIREDVLSRTFPYAVLLDNLQYDFNISGMVRNCNAFGCGNFFYYQTKPRYDKRGTVGTHVYSLVTWLGDIDAVVRAINDNGYTPIAVDIGEGAVEMSEFIYPPKPLFVFGNEGTGICDEIAALCTRKMYIEMYGSVRSLNVGNAGAIVMREAAHHYAVRSHTGS
jgi:tRNA G18 (ribose-2'-O)-methylase SpoU